MLHKMGYEYICARCDVPMREEDLNGREATCHNEWVCEACYKATKNFTSCQEGLQDVKNRVGTFQPIFQP